MCIYTCIIQICNKKALTDMWETNLQGLFKWKKSISRIIAYGKKKKTGLKWLRMKENKVLSILQE